MGLMPGVSAPKLAYDKTGAQLTFDDSNQQNFL